MASTKLNLSNFMPAVGRPIAFDLEKLPDNFRMQADTVAQYADPARVTAIIPKDAMTSVDATSDVGVATTTGHERVEPV